MLLLLLCCGGHEIAFGLRQVQGRRMTHPLTVPTKEGVDECEELQRIGPALRVQKAIHDHVLSTKLHHLPRCTPIACLELDVPDHDADGLGRDERGITAPHSTQACLRRQLAALPLGVRSFDWPAPRCVPRDVPCRRCKEYGAQLHLNC